MVKIATDRILWLVLDAILCVTWLIYWSHRRGGHGSNILTAVTYSSQSNSKLYVQKNNYVPNPPVELAHWRGTVMNSLIRAWTNGWANNRDPGDLGRHRAHYDVTGIIILIGLALRWNNCEIIVYFARVPLYNSKCAIPDHSKVLFP